MMSDYIVLWAASTNPVVLGARQHAWQVPVESIKCIHLKASRGAIDRIEIMKGKPIVMPTVA